MPTAFVRALVVDVLSNPSQSEIPTRKTISEYARKVAGDENLKNLPRNSLAVKILSNAESKSNGGDEGEVICYPFFSSHLSMPVKPGEEVWVMFEEYDPPGRSAIGYWISRVHGPRHVEDANYAYNRRTYKTSTSSASSKKRTSDKFSEKESDSSLAADPSSPKQLDSTESPTTSPTEIIELIQYAGKVHRFDPVPRYTKRPGDFVLQGSNNSLLMLGEERGHTGLVDPKTSASLLEVIGGKPAIDMVVGRKMTSTAKTVRMELLNSEIDKRVGPDESSNEGEANFADDAARIYITANSDDLTGPDSLLSLRSPSDAYPDTENEKKQIGSFIVTKADNLRSISRKSIKIIKEPPLSPAEKTLDGSAIIMNDNGYLQVAGKKVILSSYIDGSASQPYIRLDKLSDFIATLIDQQQSLNDSVTSLSRALSTFGSVAATLVPPAADLGFTSSVELTNLSALKIALSASKERISELNRQLTLGSTVIYGE
jgi:hypothetical protein